MVKPIHVLSGPNLNLLGTREPEIYGKDTLDDVRARCEARAASHGRSVVFRQSNHEGVLIDWVQEARESASALVLNPAGYGSHLDRSAGCAQDLSIPVIECHLSNPAAREEFRRHTYVSLAATGIVSGFGAASYELAIEAAIGLIGAN
jgi:3-dehydroquinate dehydratase-2